VELAPTIQLNKVSAYSVITCLGSSHHGDHIPGLTGVQVVLGFSFDAPLFTF
jgi:hypothetical protein